MWECDRESERETTDPRTDPLLGQQVGPYVIVSTLGRGGMGVVYRAVHQTLGQAAAVKVMARSGDRLRHARFLREARALSVICHPGLVQIFDCGELGDGRPYLLMELLRGDTLRERLTREPRPPVAVVMALVAQVVSVLMAVHAQGIVHRDLKPENLMLLSDPRLLGARA